MATTAPARNGRARTPRVAAAPEPTQSHGSALKAALLAVQQAAPKLRRDADGQIQSRTYKYASLDGVLDDINPLLFEQDLLWTGKPTLDDDGQTIALYRMEHVPSGEFDEWPGPLPCAQPDDPQALGSAITYMRRYTLVDYLNLAPGEDDDGAAASAPVDRYAEAEAAAAESGSTVPAGAQPSARQPKRSERPITANQREKLLRPRAQKAGLSAGEFANLVLAAAGDPPRAWTDEAHASQTLERLLDRMPARLKDAVLAGIDEAGKAKA